MSDTNKTPDSGTPNTTPEGGNNGGQATTTTDVPKTFTQEDVNRIAAERAAEERKRAEKATQEAINKALEEDRRVAKLSQEEREKELLKKQGEELAAKQKELNIKANQISAYEQLTALGIPTQFVDFVIGEDQEEMNKKIESLKGLWTKSIADEVQKIVKSGDTPKDVNKSNSNTNSKPVANNYF